MNRLETGPVKFGDDWAGVFIRGDEANYFALQIDIILEFLKKNNLDPWLNLSITYLEQLCDLLKSSYEGPGGNSQILTLKNMK